jgi:hypothetical protein
MNRIRLFSRAGFCIVGLGIALCLCGSSFATRWQSLGDDGWGGSSPLLGLSIRTLGNAALLVGFVFMAIAIWARLDAKERDLANSPKP